MKLLDVVNVSKNFGGLRALNDVSFHVDEGEILGVIGPNGAGKTTLFNVISGALKPAAGRIIFKGEDITGLSMHKSAMKGLRRTFQLTSLFKEESVLNNVLLGYYLQRKAGKLGWLLNSRYAQKEEIEIRSNALEILRYIGLSDFKDDLAKNLPHGKQRALGISIGLAGDVSLLLLDEPVTGMNPTETAEMVHLIKGLMKRGLTLVVIEHNMAALMNLADRVIVVNYGVKIAEGMPQDIRTNKDVIDAYLGTVEVV